MALVIADRVRETTSSVGTGAVTLTGAFLGFQPFSVIGNGNTTYYAIIDAAAGTWEVGVGTYTSSGNTLSRDTVLDSSNAGAPVNFASGLKDVICTQPAERAVLLDSATNATIPGITLSGGTANGVAYLNGSKALTTGSALTFDGTNFATTGSVTSAGASNSGNLTFTGTGNRITGDFSNATLANRVMFQTSTANSATSLGVIPNGTSLLSQISLDSDPAVANGSTAQFINIGGSEVRIASGIRGSGSYLPMTFHTGGSERMRIDTSGNVGIGTSSPSTYGKLGVVSGANYFGVATGTYISATFGPRPANDGFCSVTYYWDILASGNFWVNDYTSGGVDWIRYAGGSGSGVLMRLDNSGNLGIGTSSPGYKLSIATTTGGGMNMSNGVDSTLRVLLPTAGITYDNVNYGYHAWLVGGSEKMRISDSGNVGIGTSSPGSFAKLAVLQTSGSNTFQIATTTNGVGMYWVPTNGSGVQQFSYGGSLSVGTSDAQPFVFNTASAERARIDSSGNVGIGTSSPSGKLDVVGSNVIVKSNASSGYGAFYANGATGNGAYYFFAVNSTETSRIYSDASNYLAFATGSSGTERMRIDSSGNLLVGTTSPTNNSRLAVAFGTGNDGIVTSVGASTGQTHIRFVNSNGAVGSISTSGSSTAYNTSSDYRLKHDIAPMTGALAKVTALKPVTYKWNADGSDGEGFIAHELAEVVPDCVTGEKDAVETFTDENGVEQTRPVYQGIDTSFLVATLTAAIQEQQAIILAQQAALTALTARVAALESN